MFPGASASRGPASSHPALRMPHKVTENVHDKGECPKAQRGIHFNNYFCTGRKRPAFCGPADKKIILYRPRVAMSQNNLRSTAHPLPPQRAKGSLASTHPLSEETPCSHRDALTCAHYGIWGKTNSWKQHECGATGKEVNKRVACGTANVFKQILQTNTMVRKQQIARG